ncbi:MAG: phosphoribosylformylglycinamidine cyclo-ligase [Ruminococcaceae bacterium]|nr:phosphoribosylformylglycinamidine cyclo-ligase [Oscillospiraceae bacterium]
MSGSFSEIYKSAGVDITAGYKAVDLMKPHVKSTFIPGVLGGIGGFGGLFQPDLTGIKEPVLVSGTDGVGTKLKIAFLTGKFDTVGIDCVAMCVNDVVCAAAKPLFFLDYIAVGKNRPEVVADIVKGVSAGCIKAGCALIGGETAEMPGFYPEDEFDLAGFCVGLADKSKITDCASIRHGDVIIGMPSTGVHSNGFSLVRKLLVNGEDSMKVYSDELGMTVGEALLTPTEIYVKPLLALMDSVKVKGAAHITGGGFYENVPRMLPEGVCAVLDTKAIPVLPIFDLLAKTGNIEAREMYNTFNMGVGMMVAVDSADADKAVAVLRENGIKAQIMGSCKSGETGVELV